MSAETTENDGEKLVGRRWDLVNLLLIFDLYLTRSVKTCIQNTCGSI